MTTLPLLSTFTTPYEVWSKRKLTTDEQIEYYSRGLRSDYVNNKLITKITNALQAAKYIAEVGNDNDLENHIDTELANSAEYSSWRRAMPSSTPTDLSSYQERYHNCDLNKVNVEINKIGATLSIGQFLFHGGIWSGEQELTTNRPLSTTFCPQVALREVEYKHKAYDAGRIDLLVLRVAKSATNVFVYEQKGTESGHEKEVLFAAGAKLVLQNKICIRPDYPVTKYLASDKKIPIYLLEIDIH